MKLHDRHARLITTIYAGNRELQEDVESGRSSGRVAASPLTDRSFGKPRLCEPRIQLTCCGVRGSWRMVMNVSNYFGSRGV